MHEVLNADAADVVVVQAGFDGDHVAGLEQLEIARGEPGLFVDLEPDAVSEAVEVAAGESLVVDAGLESGFGERLDAEILHEVAGQSGLQLRLDRLVHVADRLVHLEEAFARLALHERAGHVAPVAVDVAAREDVGDDGRARLDGAAADAVGQGGIGSAGDDGADGGIGFALELGLDLGADEFAGQDPAVPFEEPLGVDRGFGDEVAHLVLGFLRDGLGGAELFDLVGTLHGAFGEEGTVRHDDLDAGGAELFGEDEREAFGHLPAGHAVDFADGGDEAALAVLRGLFQDVGEVDHLDAGADFAAGARDLQHGHENIAFIADLGVDELVGGEEPGPVDEVGGFGGGGGDQTRLNIFFHGKRTSSLEKGRK